MRRLVSAVLGALAVALTAAFARAQDASKDGSHDGNPSDAVKLIALDETAMLEAWDGKGPDPAPVPLRDRALRVFGGGEGTKDLEVRTDAEGAFTLPLASIAQGAHIRLLALGPDRKATHMVAPFDPRQPIRDSSLPFFRLAKESPLFVVSLYEVVSVQDPDSPRPFIRTRSIVRIQNESYEVWLGDARKGMETLRLPALRGFKVVAVKRGDEDLTYQVDESGAGAAEIVISGADFGPSRDAEVIVVVATGPYAKDAELDFSFTTALPVADLRLMLDETQFSFDASETSVLKDGGPNPDVNGIMTRSWIAQDVPAGTRVEARFVQGRRIHPRVWKTIGILALTLVGAVLLGKALASRGPGKTAVPPAPAGDDAAAQIRELEKRHARGEITDFELRARKAALAKSGAAPAESPLRTAAEIEARAANAPPEQLRKDVRTLAALLREALRR